MIQTKKGETLSLEALAAEIGRLKGMNLGQLRMRYREVCGKWASPALSTTNLLEFITQQLRSQVSESGTKEEMLRKDEIVEAECGENTDFDPVLQVIGSTATTGVHAQSEPMRWIELGGGEAPERLSFSVTQLGLLGWVRQMDGRWCLSEENSRALLHAHKRKRRPASDRGRDARLPAVDTVLTRTYKGKIFEVVVMEKGFTCEGHSYRSLSALASEITGHPTNGFTFFQLAMPRSGALEVAGER